MASPLLAPANQAPDWAFEFGEPDQPLAAQPAAAQPPDWAFEFGEPAAEVAAPPPIVDPQELQPLAPPLAIDPNDPGQLIAAEMQRVETEEQRKQRLRDEYAQSKGFGSFGEMRPETWGEYASSWKDYLGQRSIPFVSSGVEAAQAAELMAAAKRVKDGGYTDDDISLLAYHLRKRESEANQGFWPAVGDVVFRVPAFAGELLATGGVYNAGKQAAMKAVGEVAERGALRGAAEFAATRGAGVAAQTAVNPTMLAKNVAQRMTPELQQEVDQSGQTVDVELGEQDSFIEALPKGFLDSMIEIGSERAGGILGKAGHAALSKIPFANKIEAVRQAVVNRWLSQPGRTLEALQATLRQAGWNGVLGEVLEERAGDVARLATGLESPGDNVTGQLATGDFGPALEQLLVEGVAFSIPGAASLAGQVAASKLDSKRLKSSDSLSEEPPAEPEPEPAPEIPVPDIDIDDINIPGVTVPKQERTVIPESPPAQPTAEQVVAPQPAETPPESPPPAANDRRFGQGTWQPIGFNDFGQTVYQDDRGVRSILDGNVRITEPVGVSPRGEISIGERGADYLTVEEQPNVLQQPPPQVLGGNGEGSPGALLQTQDGADQTVQPPAPQADLPAAEPAGVIPEASSDSLSEQVPEQPSPKSPSSIMLSDEIPDGVEVEFDAIRAQDGERIKVRKDAKSAMKSLDESATMYKKLLACLKS